MKMNLISVKKPELLGIIKSNKELHVTEYNEAMKGYRVGVVAALETLNKDVKKFAVTVEDALKEARNGGELKVKFQLDSWSQFNELAKPETHEEDYTTVIGMIELDTSDQVELGRREYTNYVQDEWDWSEAFDLQFTGSIGNYATVSGSTIRSITSFGEQDEVK